MPTDRDPCVVVGVQVEQAKDNGSPSNPVQKVPARKRGSLVPFRRPKRSQKRSSNEKRSSEREMRKSANAVFDVVASEKYSKCGSKLPGKKMHASYTSPTCALLDVSDKTDYTIDMGKFSRGGYGGYNEKIASILYEKQ